MRKRTFPGEPPIIAQLVIQWFDILTAFLRHSRRFPASLVRNPFPPACSVGKTFYLHQQYTKLPARSVLAITNGELGELKWDG